MYSFYVYLSIKANNKTNNKNNSHNINDIIVIAIVMTVAFMSCCYYCHQVPIQLHSLDGNVLGLVSQNYSQPKKIKISFVNSIMVSHYD